ncbi:hypothetical protein BV121_1009 [Haemophilus influenzae]|nr:hypothetical protein BV121_1009 [Haemophilus influenzae]AVJ01455.1 hypothetical protein BV122_1014 [Haemophilus influenzae]
MYSTFLPKSRYKQFQTKSAVNFTALLNMITSMTLRIIHLKLNWMWCHI